MVPAIHFSQEKEDLFMENDQESWSANLQMLNTPHINLIEGPSEPLTHPF
jgi:hypothetical protein